ncbi:MAG: hypothetical protein JWO94_391 [Verrucomicrobiaceae bacterium]|nr:hypothetical protein [Verrucomicrobiaceae bacterium]
MKTPLFSLLLLLALTAVPAGVRAAQDTFRTWTSSDGKTLEAVLMAVQGDTVKLKLRTGAVVPVPLSRLSADDQAFAKGAAAAPASAGKTEPQADKPVPPSASEMPPPPAAEKTWPRTVALGTDVMPVTVVKEDVAAKKFVYRSEHYEFRCDSRLGTNVVKEFNRIFEATYLVNCKLPLDFKPTPESSDKYFVAQLYTSKDDYFASGGIKGSAGVYQGGKKELSLPLSSLGVMMVGSRVSLEPSKEKDNATLIHEITHQMMNHWLNHLPVWYAEGSAEYVSLLKYEHGRFNLSGLGERLHHYLQGQGGDGKHFTMLDLEELTSIEDPAWEAAFAKGEDQVSQNYASSALLTYYFYHLDDQRDAAHMIAYLRAVDKANTKEEHQAAFKTFLQRDRSFADLKTDVKKGLRKEGIEIDFAAFGKNPKVSEAAK